MARLLNACDVEMALTMPQIICLHQLCSQVFGLCMTRTLAALADAHDEHMAIVRMADTDQVDSVHFQQELCRHAPDLHHKALN